MRSSKIEFFLSDSQSFRHSLLLRSKILAKLIPMLVCAISVAAASQSAPPQPDRKAETQHLIDTRQLDSAEKIIVGQMMTSPRDADWITQLAEVRLGENRTREALQLIDSANKIGGLTATRAMLISLAYSQAGLMDRAEAPIRKAIELEPFNATAHYFLARLLYTDNRFDECLEESKKVIELAPSFVRAYENMGLCYEGRYQRADAEKSYLKAIQLESTGDTRTEWPMLDLAILLIQENRYDEAKSYLVQALQINPHNTQSLVQMGTLLEQNGDLDGALAQYRLAIHSDQSGLQPGRAAAYYKAARLCKKLGYTEEAQRYFAMFSAIHDKQKPVMR
jgi:tetratricopeptide (TPR) repeat protein